MGMEHTLAALAVFDSGKAERDARWENVGSNEDVFAAEKADKEAELAVQTAFYLDNPGLNSFENTKLLTVETIRYAATGHPSPGSVSIGNTGFGKLTGETDAKGKPKYHDVPYMGEERVKLLEAARDGKPLPEGLILIGRVGQAVGYVPIPREAVYWAGMAGGGPRRGYSY